MTKRTIGMLSDVDVSSIGCAALVAVELKTAQDVSLKVAEQMKDFEEVMKRALTFEEDLTEALAVDYVASAMDSISSIQELPKDLVTSIPKPSPEAFSSRRNFRSNK